jgi:hypothetical protein
MSAHPTDPPIPLQTRRRPSAVVRWKRKARELRVLDGLRTGVSLEKLAEREKVSPRRMRVIVNALLAANPDLQPADAYTQRVTLWMEQAVDAVRTEINQGGRNASGQFLRILREFERQRDIERAKGAKTSPNSEP